MKKSYLYKILGVEFLRWREDGYINLWFEVIINLILLNIEGRLVRLEIVLISGKSGME